ncbi:hypothetical protein HQ560_10810 [bacterium]|nr:hypothetical protein [bacterium]
MPSAKDRAKAIVNTFAAGRGNGAFPNVPRRDVASGLTERIDHPQSIQQGGASLCGPSALLYHVARDMPERYATFATTLYERGRATLGTLSVEPGSDLRNATQSAYRLPAPRIPLNAADWVTLASIRDSENFFLDYQAAGDAAAGITMPGKLADWYTAAGYRQVRNETNAFFCKDAVNARAASRYKAAGWKVALFISANMLNTDTRNDASTTPDHWVVLAGSIVLTADAVRLRVFTWGQYLSVPLTGSLSEENFLNNYYGYVAANP